MVRTYHVDFVGGRLPAGWEAQPPGNIALSEGKAVCTIPGNGKHYARIRRPVEIGLGELFCVYSDIEIPAKSAYMRFVGTDNYGVGPEEWRLGVFGWSDGTLRVRCEHQYDAATNPGAKSLEFYRGPRPTGRSKVALVASASKGANGLAELWIDGKLIDRHTGPTIPSSVPAAECRITRVYFGTDGGAQQTTKLSVTTWGGGVAPTNPYVTEPPPPPPPTDPCLPVRIQLDEALAQLDAQKQLTLNEKARADAADRKIAAAKTALA